MKVMRFRGFSKYLAAHYWRMRWWLIMSGHPYAQIVETAILDIPDEEFGQIAEASHADTTEYVSAVIEPLTWSERLSVMMLGLFGM